MKNTLFLSVFMIFLLSSCFFNKKTLTIIEKSSLATKNFITQSNTQTRSISCFFDGQVTHSIHKIDFTEETMSLTFADYTFKINSDNSMSLNNLSIVFNTRDPSIIALIDGVKLSGGLYNGKINYFYGEKRITGKYNKKNLNKKDYIEKTTFKYKIDKQQFSGSIEKRYAIKSPSGPSCCNYPIHIESQYIIKMTSINEREAAFLMLFIFRLLN